MVLDAEVAGESSPAGVLEEDGGGDGGVVADVAGGEAVLVQGRLAGTHVCLAWKRDFFYLVCYIFLTLFVLPSFLSHTSYRTTLEVRT